MENIVDEGNTEEKSVNIDQVEAFAKNTLPSIAMINAWYKKFFDGAGENPSFISKIERNLESIKLEYESLFVAPNESGLSKVAELNAKLEEIRLYNKELLEDPASIKSSISEMQSKILNFFQSLFGANGTSGESENLKRLIKEISNFHTDLTKEGGIKQSINDSYTDVVNKHAELFVTKNEDSEETKIQQLVREIEKIDAFSVSIDSDILPKINAKQDYLDKLRVEIDAMKGAINELLSTATVATLATGYQESKEEYSKRRKTEYKGWYYLKDYAFNAYAFFDNLLFRHLSVFLSYFVFVFPLIVVLVVFLEPKLFAEQFNFSIIKNTGGEQLKGWEILIIKMSVSLPMFWIAWFGQRNISQRKRLSEEYNHKLRVVQIYRMFTDNEKSYNFSDKSKLEDALLEVVKNNPAKILDKGETMIDKMMEKFRMKGFYNELKGGIVEDLKLSTKSTVINQDTSE